MSEFRISRQAEVDQEDIWLYIAHDNPQAADRLIAKIIGKYRKLARFPDMGSSYEELGLGLRGFVVGNYVVFYRPIENGIEVVRLLHAARDLRSLFRRER